MSEQLSNFPEKDKTIRAQIRQSFGTLAGGSFFNRVSRYQHLKDLKAPQVIITSEERMVSESLARLSALNLFYFGDQQSPNFLDTYFGRTLEKVQAGDYSDGFGNVFNASQVDALHQIHQRIASGEIALLSEIPQTTIDKMRQEVLVQVQQSQLFNRRQHQFYVNGQWYDLGDSALISFDLITTAIKDSLSEELKADGFADSIPFEDSISIETSFPMIDGRHTVVELSKWDPSRVAKGRKPLQSAFYHQFDQNSLIRNIYTPDIHDRKSPAVLPIYTRQDLASLAEAATLPRGTKAKLIKMITESTNAEPSQAPSQLMVAAGFRTTPTVVKEFMLSRLDYIEVDDEEVDYTESAIRRMIKEYQQTGKFEGVCRHIADLYAATLTALNIPARTISGMVLNQHNHIDRHAWNEFLTAEKSWLPVDILGPRIMPIGRNSDPEETGLLYLIQGNIILEPGEEVVIHTDHSQPTTR